ncbi:hypothetical protein [Nesterenkonia suensis]
MMTTALTMGQTGHTGTAVRGLGSGAIMAHLRGIHDGGAPRGRAARFTRDG